jgi:hypothetical protein
MRLRGRADARKGAALAASAFLLVVLASVALIASPSVGGREVGGGGAAASALLEASSSSRQRSHEDLHGQLYRRGAAAVRGNADSQFLTTFKPLPVNQGPRPIVDVYAPYEVSNTPSLPQSPSYSFTDLTLLHTLSFPNPPLPFLPLRTPPSFSHLALHTTNPPPALGHFVDTATDLQAILIPLTTVCGAQDPYYCPGNRCGPGAPVRSHDYTLGWVGNPGQVRLDRNRHSSS